MWLMKQLLTVLFIFQKNFFVEVGRQEVRRIKDLGDLIAQGLKN